MLQNQQKKVSKKVKDKDRNLSRFEVYSIQNRSERINLQELGSFQSKPQRKVAGHGVPFTPADTLP